MPSCWVRVDQVFTALLSGFSSVAWEPEGHVQAEGGLSAFSYERRHCPGSYFDIWRTRWHGLHSRRLSSTDHVSLQFHEDSGELGGHVYCFPNINVCHRMQGRRSRSGRSGLRRTSFIMWIKPTWYMLSIYSSKGEAKVRLIWLHAVGAIFKTKILCLYVLLLLLSIKCRRLILWFNLKLYAYFHGKAVSAHVGLQRSIYLGEDTFSIKNFI